MNNNIGVSRFILSIFSLQDPDKELNWKINMINNGIPVEVIVIQLKALVKKFENNYFAEFDSKLIK